MNSPQKPNTKPRKERKENAQMRRRQILDATYRSIVSNGLSKTTLATVANEAGLSQGVAVFYYKSKNGLLSAALEDIYEHYQTHWTKALDTAGEDPKNKLFAVIEADFDEAVCNRDTLSVWFAFYGEQNFTPQYAQIAQKYDEHRSGVLETICRELVDQSPELEISNLLEWIEILTDGYWQRIHLFPQTCSPQDAMNGTKAFFEQILGC